jgi:hypothetical protein
MQRFTNEAIVPLAITGFACIVLGVVGVVVVLAGYRSEVLLGASCTLVFLGILGAVAGSRIR